MLKSKKEAGRELAKRFKKLKDEGLLEDIVVVAIPKNGVEVAKEIAKELNAPMDIVFVKRLEKDGVVFGAVAEAGQIFLNKEIVERLNLDENEIREIAIDKIQEIARERDYLKHEPILLEGKDVIIVDDGAASGVTLYLAAQSVVRDLPRTISVGLGVVPNNEEVLKMIKGVSHHQEILKIKDNFMNIAKWYEVYDKLSLDDLKEIL